MPYEQSLENGVRKTEKVRARPSLESILANAACESHMPPQQDTAAESRTQCETLINQFLAALNGKDFAPSTWDRIAPRMRVAWGILYLQEDGDKMLALHEWLPLVRRFAAEAPNYHFEISNLTTVVDEKAGTAESLLNVELSGVFPSIVRQSVAGFGFVRSEGGGWEVVRHGAFAGPSF